MENPIISSTRIRFLSPIALIQVISKIETSLPGWWWSISQQKDNWIGFNCGPGQNCPNSFDTEYSKTKAGDQGFVLGMFLMQEESDTKFTDWLDRKIQEINIKTQAFIKSQDHISLSQPSVIYRKQNLNDLEQLKSGYTNFLKEVNLFEDNSHILKELYLGSCDLSVDCSIRGKITDGDEFDISIDYLTGSIADSLQDATSELKNNILTCKEKVKEPCSLSEQSQS